MIPGEREERMNKHKPLTVGKEGKFNEKKNWGTADPHNNLGGVAQKRTNLEVLFWSKKGEGSMDGWGEEPVWWGHLRGVEGGGRP